MKKYYLARKITTVLGFSIVTVGLMFSTLVNAGGRAIPIPEALDALACYCLDPADHIALSNARAECDTFAVQGGFPHGFVRPLTTRNYNDLASVCIACDDVEYACFVADPPRRKLPPEQ